MTYSVPIMAFEKKVKKGGVHGLQIMVADSYGSKV